MRRVGGEQSNVGASDGEPVEFAHEIVGSAAEVAGVDRVEQSRHIDAI